MKEKQARDFEEESLDLSNAIYINLPELEIPKNLFKPQEYWDLFNKGESLYKQKDYLAAKKTFLKILKKYHDPDHQTFKSYLLRTFRKIINSEIKSNDLNRAYDTFIEFFDVCKEDITNTDIRKYNKIVKELSKIDSNKNFQKMDLKDDPEFFIKGNKSFISLINETKFGKDNDPRIRYWDKLIFKKYHTLYAGRENDNYYLKTRDLNGDIRSLFYTNHAIYHINDSFYSDKLVVTDDLILYLYSINKGLLKELDLKSFTDNKYEIRCIDVSPEGNFLLFSHINKAYLLNLNLNIIAAWKTPITKPSGDGWEKRTSSELIDSTEIDKNLSILGLSGKLDYSEIKKRFKKLVLELHPDRNPDPMAGERLKQIISAYEYLTGESVEDFFKESDDGEFYYKVFSKNEYKVPNSDISFTLEIGSMSKSEDWIYATYLDYKARNIYLGCYSGKIYGLSKDGIVDVIIDCHNPARFIKKHDAYFFIETDFYLYFVKDNTYLNHVKIQNEKIYYLDDYLMLKSRNEIKFYSFDGNYISSAKFKNNISDIYITRNGLNLSTSNKTYELSINFNFNKENSNFSEYQENFFLNTISCNSCGTKNPFYAIYCQECGKAIKIDISAETKNILERKKKIDNETSCPYCNEILKPKPKRKKKCPFCGNYIYVRTSPTTRKKLLLTEQGTKDIEKEWGKYHRTNQILNNFKMFGVTGNDFSKHKKLISDELNSEPNDLDVIESIYKELISKNTDFHTLKMIHFQMAIYLNGEGKDHFKILQEAAKMELMFYKQRNINNVKISTAGEQSCESCQKLQDKILSIDDAFEKMPIPCRNCSYSFSKESKGFCRCIYVPVII